MKPRGWWDRSLDELEREISRLQNILKNRAQYSHKTVGDATRRLPLLKVIRAARRSQKPLFPLEKE